MNKQKVLDGATAQLKAGPVATIKFELERTLAVGLIGQLQLAFRHPGNVGPSRTAIEALVRELIERLDPDHGDLYRLLLMGFEEKYDE